MKRKLLKDKYDWLNIQKYYNDEHTLDECCKHFNVGRISLLRAVKAGFLKVRNRSDASKLRISKTGPNRPNKEWSKQLSIRQSLHNTGGKCKWYTVNGQKVQGTWERDICKKLLESNILWYKPVVNRDCWSYVDKEGKTRHYTPDLFLPNNNLWLEIKGYWWGKDKEKMEIVQKTYPERKIIIITKNEFKKIMDGELVW